MLRFVAALDAGIDLVLCERLVLLPSLIVVTARARVRLTMLLLSGPCATHFGRRLRAGEPRHLRIGCVGGSSASAAWRACWYDSSAFSAAAPRESASRISARYRL